jgi:hypothetical protein
MDRVLAGMHQIIRQGGLQLKPWKYRLYSSVDLSEHLGEDKRCYTGHEVVLGLYYKERFGGCS